MRMKNFIKILALALTFVPSLAFAQVEPQKSDIFQKMNEHGVFNTIELAANVGTSGFGIEVASPVTKWAKLRVGMDFMPKFDIPMTFGLDNYVDGQVGNKFDRIQELMYDMSGMTIDKDIHVQSKPTMNNLRVIVDVYPFRNRHWHVSAGFFVGAASVGTAVNKMEEMPSLLAMNMYDRLYDGITSPDFLEQIIDRPIFSDVYLDPEVAVKLQEKMLEYGELGIHVGDYKDGTPYMMMPDEDGMVKAKAKVNRFRPYVGFGYEGGLSDDGRWMCGFDAGVQFWGGCPKVTTHDGTVLNDLVNLRGKVNNYMDIMKALVVYPTINFRISYRF